MKNIVFDTLGAQVQVQYETGDRLTTWTSALQGAGYTVNYTNYTKPLAPQLGGAQVLITTTHQRADAPNFLPAVAPGTNFGYASTDLGGLQDWIYNQGGSLLLFVNHSVPLGQGPYWPINDIQLAAALGITTVFATIDLTGFTLTPNPDAPAELIDGVSTLNAWDSGGIVPGQGTVLVPLPAGCTDGSGLGYDTAQLAFAVLYSLGKGKVIVIGHSGITGNAGTDFPSPGQIGDADNLQFLMNCVDYLAGGD